LSALSEKQGDSISIFKTSSAFSSCILVSLKNRDRRKICPVQKELKNWADGKIVNSFVPFGWNLKKNQFCRSFCTHLFDDIQALDDLPEDNVLAVLESIQ
jgi:hypothetical protein